MNKFSFDTSAFIEPWKRFYPLDIFPSMWNRFEIISESNIIIASECVFIELEKKSDKLFEWAKKIRPFEIKSDDTIEDNVNEIVNKFPGLVDMAKKKSTADPYVIAVAMSMNASVVSYEGGKKGKTKIPDVCKYYNIEYLDLVGFFRKMNWKFDLV